MRVKTIHMVLLTEYDLSIFYNNYKLSFNIDSLIKDLNLSNYNNLAISEFIQVVLL